MRHWRLAIKSARAKVSLAGVGLISLAYSQDQPPLMPAPDLHQSGPSSQDPFPIEAIRFSPWRALYSDDLTTEYLAQFPSPFRSGSVQNDTVQLRVLLPTNGPDRPPIVLILHYWGAPDLRIERALASDLNERGIGAAILTLPYHLSRTPAGATSGALAIRPDPELLQATMIQAVQDTRRSVDFIKQRPECGRILGIYGTSLGAIISSLSLGVDPDLNAGVFLLGGSDLASIIWKSSLLTGVRAKLEARGYDLASLTQALKAIEPAPYLRSKTPPPKSLIIRAKYDTVIPPPSTDALVQALGNPTVLEIDTGHYGGIFIQNRLLREVANFFESLSSGKPYVKPEAIIAPTIRVGLLTVHNKFSVAMGLDLWKLDQKGTGHVTLLTSPSGVHLWAGSRLTKNISLGIAGGTERSGVALLWTSVL